jgi:hypothetical protein
MKSILQKQARSNHSGSAKEMKGVLDFVGRNQYFKIM